LEAKLYSTTALIVIEGLFCMAAIGWISVHAKMQSYAQRNQQTWVRN